MPTAQYQNLKQQLQQADIELVITRKRVKNINFRLKPNKLLVSAPYHVSDANIAYAIHNRLDWVISQHRRVLQRHQQSPTAALPQQSQTAWYLWGDAKAQPVSETQRLVIYRQALQSAMPDLFAKWQPIVGKTANETRIKKMTTRWGSCNTKAKRVWLSVYLPAYPIECTEYVIVHELCHLHHANHSSAFWAEVERAMPEYQRWHDRLAGKTGSVD